MDRKWTPASPATALAMRVLPVPGGPTSSTPLGMRAPRAVKLLGVPEELHDLLQLLLLLIRTGHIVEGDLLRLVGQGAGAGVAEAGRAGSAAAAPTGLAPIHEVHQDRPKATRMTR